MDLLAQDIFLFGKKQMWYAGLFDSESCEVQS